MFKTDCKDWQGYLPCIQQREGRSTGCVNCDFYSPLTGNSLIIEAGGLGSIVRTTVVSKEIKSQFPGMQVQWLSHKKGVELLKNVPSVDYAFTADDHSVTLLQAQEFDRVINYESSPIYLAITKLITARDKTGFQISPLGQMIPIGESAVELLNMQTSDHFRGKVNRKPMQQVLLEMAGLEWKNQTYDLATLPPDDEWAREYLYEMGLLGSDPPRIIGLNLGSSAAHDAKIWDVRNYYTLAREFGKRRPEWNFLVLAGPDDEALYNEFLTMNEAKPLPNLHFSGYKNSISRFISLVNRIPLLITADTFGLHVAIGLQKRVISLHGPQPEQEIHLYGSGTKLHLGLECAPCFALRPEHCKNPEPLICMRGITVERVLDVLTNDVRDL